MFVKFSTCAVTSVVEKKEEITDNLFHIPEKDGMVYVRVRAISSRVNKNYDGFEREELEKSYKTFIGKPVFIEHQNNNPEYARGLVVDAAFHDDEPEAWIELLLEIDGEAYPLLAEGLRKGRINKVSMGTNVAYSVCSVCGNEARNENEFCEHVRQKGKFFKNAKGEDVLAYEINRGLDFFEISFVVSPADPDADVLAVYGEQDKEKMKKIASQVRRRKESLVKWGKRTGHEPNLKKVGTHKGGEMKRSIIRKLSEKEEFSIPSAPDKIMSPEGEELDRESLEPKEKATDKTLDAFLERLQDLIDEFKANKESEEEPEEENPEEEFEEESPEEEPERENTEKFEADRDRIRKTAREKAKRRMEKISQTRKDYIKLADLLAEIIRNNVSDTEQVTDLVQRYFAAPNFNPARFKSYLDDKLSTKASGKTQKKVAKEAEENEDTDSRIYLAKTLVYELEKRGAISPDKEIEMELEFMQLPSEELADRIDMILPIPERKPSRAKGINTMISPSEKGINLSQAFI